jgi:phage baseplate assembly protein gpV
MSEVAREIRRLWKAIEGARQRRDETLVEAVVHARQGARLKVEIGKDDKGKSIISPWLKVPANTGKRGGGVSKFTRFGIGEAVLVVSPSGRLGPRSAVMPWVDTGDDPSPGSAEADGEVTEIGDARLEIRDGFARLSVGDASITITAGKITIAAPQVQIDGSGLRHNDRNIGDDHAHVTAPPGPPGPPV